MNEELIRQCARETVGEFDWFDHDTAEETATKAIRLYHARHVAPLVEAAENLMDLADGFSASGVYFSEPCMTENVEALAAVRMALAAFGKGEEEGRVTNDLPQWAVERGREIVVAVLEGTTGAYSIKQTPEETASELVAFIARALADAAKPKWQPIETAPMPEVGAPGYGARVLLAVDCGNGTVKDVRVGWWDGSGWDAQNLGYRVTHWMPLPAAPALAPFQQEPEA